MLKFRAGKFSYNSICTKNFQDILSLQKFVYVLLEKTVVVFAAITYYKNIWREAIGE